MTDILDCTEEELSLFTDTERMFLRSSYEPNDSEVTPTKRTIRRHARFLVDVKKSVPDIVAEMIAEDNNGNIYVHWNTLFSFLDGQSGTFTFRREDEYGEAPFHSPELCSGEWDRACASADGTGDLLGTFEDLSDAVDFAVKHLKSEKSARKRVPPQQTLDSPVPNMPLMKHVLHSQVTSRYPQTAKVFNVLLGKIEESYHYLVGNEDDDKRIVEDISKLNTFFEKHYLTPLASSTNDGHEYALHFTKVPEYTEVDPMVICAFAFEFMVLPWILDNDEEFHNEIMSFNTLMNSHDLNFAILPLYKHDVKFIRYE